MLSSSENKPVNILFLGSDSIYQQLKNSSAPDKVIAVQETFVGGAFSSKKEYDFQNGSLGLVPYLLPSQALFILGGSGVAEFEKLEGYAHIFKDKPIIFVMDDAEKFQQIKQKYGLKKAERCSVAEANSEYFQEKIKFKQNVKPPVAFDVQEPAKQNFGPHRFFKASAGGIMMAGGVVGGALLAKAVLTGTLLLAHLASGFLIGGAAILMIAIFAIGLKMLINNTCKFQPAAVS